MINLSIIRTSHIIYKIDFFCSKYWGGFEECKMVKWIIIEHNLYSLWMWLAAGRWQSNTQLFIPPLVERGLYCNHLVCPSVHTFVKDVSAATGRNDFIFNTWLWQSDLYRVSPFQAYRTSTSCLPRDLEFFMFAVMKTFVTDISASTGRNDLIFDIWLWHGDLYRVSPFQVYRAT
jgi:hypothetical protein